MTETVSNDTEIINGASIVCRILLIGSLLAAGIIWTRLFNRGGAIAVASGSVNVPANCAWILFLALTIGHRIYAGNLFRNVFTYWKSHTNPNDDEKPPDGGLKLFEQIRSQPNMFVFGLVPRRHVRPGSARTVMDWSDPSTMVSYFAVVAFLIAILPWYITGYVHLRWATGLALWLPIGAALFIAWLNWNAGTIWTSALSYLTLRRNEAEFFLRREKKLAARTAWFPGLGVAVRDGNIYQHGIDRNGSFSNSQAKSERKLKTDMKLLGPLAGAHAELAGGQAGTHCSGGQRVADTTLNTLALGSFGLDSALNRKGFEVFAVVSFADGTIYKRKFEKKYAEKVLLSNAQLEAVQFNALADSGHPVDSAASGSAESSAQGGARVASELERLAALHASGDLDNEEFRTVKERIIGN